MSNLTNNLGPRGSMCEKKKQSPQPSTPLPPPRQCGLHYNTDRYITWCLSFNLFWHIYNIKKNAAEVK